MNKSELRKSYLSRQRTISSAERAEKSTQIADNFFAGVDLTQVNFLHCFVAIEKFNEIDTSAIFHGIWKQFPQIRTVVPRVDFETGELESVSYTADTELEQNRWSIHEPLHDEIVEAERIDMVLTPGLAYDRSGHRVGYGKGFYDRFLDRCRPDCVKVGLSYFEPIEVIQDAYEGDVRLDFVVTPEGKYTVKTQS